MNTLYYGDNLNILRNYISDGVPQMILLLQEPMSNEVFFKLWIDLLVALSNFAWPAVVIVALVIFRKPISAFIGKIRKLELFGTKGELEPELDALQSSVNKVTEQLRQITREDIDTGLRSEELEIEYKSKLDEARLDDISLDKAREDDSEVKGILDDAKIRPEIGLIRLSGILERESKAVLGSMGFLSKKNRPVSARAAVSELERRGLMPKGTTIALLDFFKIRNKIVHGKGDVEEKELLRVIDIGIDLLKAVYQIRHEKHIVMRIFEPIFSDESLTVVRDSVVAVMILSASSPESYAVRTFHTTRVNYYAVGRQVSWEWDSMRSFPDSWYISFDQTTKKLDGSLDFVGRLIEDL